MSKRNCRHALLAGVASVVFALSIGVPAQGGQIPVPLTTSYEAAAATWNGDGSSTIAPYNLGAGLEIGTGLAGGLYRAPIFSFQLPILPAGEQVVSAKLEVPFLLSMLYDAYADLDALNITTESAAQASYFQAPGTQIVDNFLHFYISGNTVVSTNAAQSDALGTWISSQYLAGSYLNLRVKFDAEPKSDGYTCRMFPDASLILTTVPVPEPTMLGGIAVTGLLLLRRRCGQRAEAN